MVSMLERPAWRHAVVPSKTVGKVKLILPSGKGRRFLNRKLPRPQQAQSAFKSDLNQLLAQGASGQPVKYG